MESFRIGVLWSTHVVRVALFRSNGARLTLQSLARITAETSNISAVTETLRTWSSKHIPPIAEVKAVVSVSEGVLFLKDVDVPRASRREVSEAVRWELLTRNAAFPKDSVISWLYAGNNPSGNVATAFAMREAESDLIRGALSDLGWEVTAIEPFTVSIGRLGRYMPKPLLMVDFEGNQASVGIVEAGTARYGTLMDLDQSEASGSEGHITRTAATSLIPNLRQTLSYWQSRGNGAVSGLTITGDGADMGPVVRLLTKPLGLEHVPVPITLPRGISLGKHRDHAAGSYAVPVGAALRMTDTQYDEDVNLLPREERFRVTSVAIRRLNAELARQLTAASMALTLAGVVLLAANAFVSGRLTRDIAQNNRFIQNHPAQAMVGDVTQANALTGSVLTLMRGSQDTGTRLAFYADHTPPGISYTTMKYAATPEREWIIEGTGSRDDILAFYYELKRSAPNAKLSMPYSSLSKAKDGAFSIRIIW